MLIASTWSAGSGTIAAPAQPAVAAAYTLTGWSVPIDLGTSAPTGRVPVNINASPSVLAQVALDFRFPPITQAPLVFSDYQAGMRVALQNRLLNSSLTVSVTPPGGTAVKLPASPAYQSYFANLAAYCNAGLTYGSLTGTSTLPVHLPGGNKSVAVNTILGFYKLYLDAIAAWQTVQAQIECAQQISDLDAITIT